MSQIRNWSAKLRPSNPTPSSVAELLAARARARDQVAPVDLLPVRARHGHAGARPGRCRRPRGPSGPRCRDAAAMARSRNLLGLALRDVDERRERRSAAVGEGRANSSRSPWKVRAVVQVTPRSAISRPGPAKSQMSSTSRCWQIDLLPTAIAPRLARPARRPAHPSGPAAARQSARPARSRRRRRDRPSVLQRVPHLAVALGGPDRRPLDAVELVPEPLHVEGQAVLEDRPPCRTAARAPHASRRRRP